LKDLDRINPHLARPSRFVSLMAVLPLILSGVGMALATGAAKSVPFYQNPVWLFCAGVMGFSSLMLFVPRIFSWDWRAEYFGVGGLFLGSVCMIGGVAWVSVLIYSSLPLWLRIPMFGIYVYMIVFWSWRFVRFYRDLFSNNTEFGALYHEEAGACYYKQKADKKVGQSKKAPVPVPSPVFIVLATLLAVLSLFFARELSSYVGLPIVHIFLAVMSVPLDMMFFGFVVRSALVYFYYPAVIYKQSGLRVYVDMATA